MIVGEIMSQPVLTANQEWSINTALHLMHQHDIHRLPVIDEQENLVGIVSESDLLRVLPLSATNLSVLEQTYIFNKLTVAKIMAREVITINEDTSIQTAARIMVENKIGGLPVVRGDQHKVVGIITETDIFKLFLNMFKATE
jgi:acetoin utilization protein AcuB